MIIYIRAMLNKSINQIKIEKNLLNFSHLVAALECGCNKKRGSLKSAVFMLKGWVITRFKNTCANDRKKTGKMIIKNSKKLQNRYSI
ncbi:hypothetical protein BpHYR1_053037 [Brachionus plicatilis]|uniref:Uncharacterized protein n=1 Tax=Brachionus plicatilis TaxID=10195 RepID=A0A3M7T0Q3_BRAPC|nr:hypothetical protein BpHYR1_053037 [Brachionus plicatilis]